ncbi:helix-turn-helix transcriptional regulator [Frankia sp. Cas3]|uniref:response regulator transcription factor n=1 Tax=Frankia sp. Cas3 TaxID=3073926 RepID=UPI002AD361E2|nr:helix-turn-helix transcriptional regulator [Frankia sp. Cas3]
MVRPPAPSARDRVPLGDSGIRRHLDAAPPRRADSARGRGTRTAPAGRTSKEIAADLVLSLLTVNRHVANIYTKIGARNRAEATAFAIAHGLSAKPTNRTT